MAVKLLRSDLARDAMFLIRFRREAQAAAGLNHPNIVAIYDSGEDETVDPGTEVPVHIPYIVMEVVDGRTRSDIVPLEGGERVEEIARMLGGLTVTKKTRDVAAELLRSAAS